MTIKLERDINFWGHPDVTLKRLSFSLETYKIPSFFQPYFSTRIRKKNKMFSLSSAILLSIFSTLTLSAKFNGTVQQSDQSIQELLASKPSYSKFSQALQGSKPLTDLLNDPNGNFTVFAMSGNTPHFDDVFISFSWKTKLDTHSLLTWKDKSIQVIPKWLQDTIGESKALTTLLLATHITNQTWSLPPRPLSDSSMDGPSSGYPSQPLPSQPQGQQQKRSRVFGKRQGGYTSQPPPVPAGSQPSDDRTSGNMRHGQGGGLQPDSRKVNVTSLLGTPLDVSWLPSSSSSSQSDSVPRPQLDRAREMELYVNGKGRIDWVSKARNGMVVGIGRVRGIRKESMGGVSGEQDLQEQEQERMGEGDQGREQQQWFWELERLTGVTQHIAQKLKEKSKTSLRIKSQRRC